MDYFLILLFFMQPKEVECFSIQPPSGVKVYDTPYDAGENLTIEWNLSPQDSILNGYTIWKKEEGKTFEKLKTFPPGVKSYQDKVKDGVRYTYKISAVFKGRDYFSSTASAVASPQWYDVRKTNIFLAMVFFLFTILTLINKAKRGEEVPLRRIPGLERIDEAVGRATEMGRPILYIPSSTGIEDIATIAAVNILPGIARKTAQYGTPLRIPNRDPIVYTVTREVVKQAYTDAGRPDAFDPNSVSYITGDQFGYTSAVNGIMVRERTAANFFMGMFYAEALLLAEVGAQTGAIQIAGTDSIAQLPFFIVTCDHTLIGEELYAASAYISKEPTLVGTIKGQDYGKVGILVALGVGVVFSLVFGWGEFILKLLAT